jgi:hypothetical protein
MSEPIKVRNARARARARAPRARIPTRARPEMARPLGDGLRQIETEARAFRWSPTLMAGPALP